MSSEAFWLSYFSRHRQKGKNVRGNARFHPAKLTADELNRQLDAKVKESGVEIDESFFQIS